MSNKLRFECYLNLLPIQECLYVAGHYGGRVFGSFVRDIIILRSHDGEIKPIDIYIDIWFTNQNEADEFLTEMGSKLIEYNLWLDRHSVPSKGYYLNDRNGNHVARVYIVISSTIPVNDLNIHRLTYQYTLDIISNTIIKSFGPESETNLINSILNKQAIVLPEYIELMNRNASYLSRLQYFIDQGWNLSILTTIPPNVTIDWFQQHIDNVTEILREDIDQFMDTMKSELIKLLEAKR